MHTVAVGVRKLWTSCTRLDILVSCILWLPSACWLAYILHNFTTPACFVAFLQHTFTCTHRQFQCPSLQSDIIKVYWFLVLRECSLFLALFLSWCYAEVSLFGIFSVGARVDTNISSIMLARGIFAPKLIWSISFVFLWCQFDLFGLFLTELCTKWEYFHLAMQSGRLVWQAFN